MDRTAVDEAVDSLRIFVSADGADIHLVDFDPAARRAEVRLDFSGVECLDCVIPPELLADLLQDRWAGADTSVTLVVRDSRRTTD